MILRREEIKIKEKKIALMRLGYYSSVRWLTENDGAFSINPEEEKKGGGEGRGEGKKKHEWDWKY